MEIANSTWTFSSKNALWFKNAVQIGVREKHALGAAAFIHFYVRCLLPLKLQVVLILEPKVIY